MDRSELLAAFWLVILEVEALTSSHTKGLLALNLLAVGAMALAGLGVDERPCSSCSPSACSIFH